MNVSWVSQSEIYTNFGTSLARLPYKGDHNDAALLIWNADTKEVVIAGNEAIPVMKRTEVYTLSRYRIYEPFGKGGGVVVTGRDLLDTGYTVTLPAIWSATCLGIEKVQQAADLSYFVVNAILLWVVSDWRISMIFLRSV